MLLKNIQTPKEIMDCFEAYLELRPHLHNEDFFLSQVQNQQNEGYKIIAIKNDDEFVACLGYRIITTLAWGKIIYIDDLVTKAKHRGKGYGKFLLDEAIKIARNNECRQVHLDTGYARHVAHKLYLNKGFELNSHHMALNLEGQ